MHIYFHAQHLNLNLQVLMVICDSVKLTMSSANCKWFGLVATIALFTFTPSDAQNQNAACIDVQQELQGLTTAVQSLCGSSTTQTPERKVTWTSVSRVLIGSSDIQTAATYSYTIPNSIPNEAKEVLVLAVGRQGYSSRDIDTYLKIYTLEGSSHYEQYIYMHSYDQSAYNTVSDNLWFPMTSNRRIYLQVPNTNGGGNWVGLYAIGYR